MPGPVQRAKKRSKKGNDAYCRILRNDRQESRTFPNACACVCVSLWSLQGAGQIPACW